MFFPIHASTWVTLAQIFPWVSSAPLETPVVPPVYCKKAESSLFTLTVSPFLPLFDFSIFFHETLPEME